MRKIATGAFLAMMLASIPASVNSAWSGGCSSGRACMWRGNYGSSEVLSNNTSDSNYSGDYYVSGQLLNNNVKNVHNNLSVGNGVRAFTGASYGGSGSICIPFGWVVGPYPLGVSGGVSSHNGCS
jgi:hypothetical protein